MGAGRSESLLPAAHRALRALLLAALASVAGCGGGAGNSATAFAVSATDPASGDVSIPVSAVFLVTFTRPADLTTVHAGTLKLETAAGGAVPATILTQTFDASNVRLAPTATLAINAIYRLVVSKEIRDRDGSRLAAGVVASFITATPGPTVRPDQLADLGEVLQQPRYLAQAVREPRGAIVLFGGYRSATEVTDTAEVFLPATRSFRQLAARMGSPRAQFTATLLASGKVLIAGGYAAAGGEPLASTELYDPATETFAPGPDLLVARARHAAAELPGSGEVTVTGGVGPGGVALDTGERLLAGAWTMLLGAMERPTFDHALVAADATTLYGSVGNTQGKACLVRNGEIFPRTEFDARFRTVALKLDGARVLLIGGDTRTLAIFDLAAGSTFAGMDLLDERRGAHTATQRGGAFRFLVAGGFNIARAGEPALASLEIVDYIPSGAFGLPDATSFPVPAVELPIPFAGHVAGTTIDGSVLLAGGFAPGGGLHSRRAVLILP